MSGAPVGQLLLLVLGILLLAQGVAGLLMVRRARGWPSTSGVISASRVERQRDRQGRVTETHVLSYRYEVHGRTFEGRRVAAGGTLFTWTAIAAGASSARRSFERYPTDRPVRVYYDPAKPQRACLERGGEASAAASVALGTGLLGLALWLLAGP